MIGERLTSEASIIALNNRLQHRVFSALVLDTLGGTRAYKNNLCFGNEEEFIAYITGKRVLDVGSGMGGLAKDCKLGGIDAEIISVNPRLSNTRLRREERFSTRVCIPEEMQDEVQRAHDRKAVAAYGQFLPFGAETFDVVLDSCGVLFSTRREDDRWYAIQEFWRVLRPGGRMRMGWLAGSSRPERQMFDSMQIPYEVIFTRNIFLRWFMRKKAFEVKKPCASL